MKPDSRYSMAEHKLDSVLEMLRGRSQGILLPESDRLLKDVLDDFANAMEELRAAHAEVDAQRQELAEACWKAQLEHQRYVELFEDAPDGYVVTDLHGVIEQANLAAAELFDSARDFIAGKPLSLFVNKEDRKSYFEQLNRMGALEAVRDWELRFQSWKGEPFQASINIAKVQIPEQEDISLRWLIRDISNRKQSEEILRRYALLARHGRDILLFMRRDDGRILEANAAAIKAYGYSYEELLTLTIDDLRAPDTRMLTLEQMAAADTGGILFETLHRRKDGIIFPVEVSSRGETIEGARTLISAIRDITQRKRREDIVHVRLDLQEFAASHSSEELLQKTLDEICRIINSPTGFFHFVERDQKTLSLQAWSTRTVQEFCGAQGKGRHYPIEKAGVWVDCIHARRPVIHNDYPALAHRKGMPGGHPPVIRELTVPIVRSGRVEAILGVGNKHEDYTQEDVETASYLADVAWEIIRRKLAEEELKKTYHKLNLTLESITDGFFSVDREWRFTYFNITGAEMLGMKREDLVGGVLWELFPEAVNLEFHSRYRYAAESNTPVHFEEYYPSPLDKWWECHAYPSPAGLSVYFRDITEHKLAEEALRRAHDELELRVQERTAELQRSEKRLRSLASELLIAGENERKLIAQEIHDGLSSQLAAIKFFLENRLRPGQNPAESSEITGRACAMIDDAIEETRRVMANLRPSILDDLGILPTINWLCREFQKMNPAISPRVKFEVCEEDIPDSIKTVIFRMLQEALNNIHKYSRAERVEISLRRIGRSIVFRIRDNGQGFSPRKALSGNKIGHGFGLRGMRERVELSGGKCVVKSAPGKGVSICAGWDTNISRVINPEPGQERP
ncbi:MAG: PAS domain S-box protein [Syntrophobacteraceae bacterium]